jgi:hypothetical protein
MGKNKKRISTKNCLAKNYPAEELSGEELSSEKYSRQKTLWQKHVRLVAKKIGRRILCQRIIIFLPKRN